MFVIRNVMVCLVLSLWFPTITLAQMCNVDEYRLPADIPVPNSAATASTFQEFSWNSFLGLNAPQVGMVADPTDLATPQWSRWSSTVDMLSCTVLPTPAGCECPQGNCFNSGSHYYPTACRGIPNYDHYRVLDQVGKVDDSFLQAQTRGVSNDPVIDRFGGFLRFEILLSPATYNNVIEQDLYDQAHLQTLTDDVNMICGNAEYTGGNPANEEMGALVLKNAWMDVENPSAANSLDLDRYHTEKLLVYTPSYRNATGVESCELRNMALVGMHVEHKTRQQPNWIWTTFEHQDNAPSCTAPLPAPQPGQAGANMNCPASVSKDFNFFGTQCNNDGSACAECNSGPDSNDPDNVCVNPTSSNEDGWCLDSPPAAQKGMSKICRQVPVLDDPFAPLPNPLPADYPQAAFWNHQCVTALTESGPNVWANYMLISGQWLKGSYLPTPPPPPAQPECINVAEVIATTVHTEGGGGPVQNDAILPAVTVDGGASRPFLGNTSMESYDRANCAGCHAKAILTNADGDILSTDFMYWLSLEVAAQEANFLSYWLDYVDSSCTGPDDQVKADFILNGAVQNAFVEDQTFDLVVAIEIPSNVTDPALTAHALEHPDVDWVLNGETVLFEVDPNCAPGACQADDIYPTGDGQRWVQFRTVNPVSISEEDRYFSSALTYTFSNQCVQLSDADFRVWASDTSQQEYANFVDGDLQSGMFMMFTGIPVLGPAGLGGLVLILMLTGFWLLPRVRAD